MYLSKIVQDIKKRPTAFVVMILLVVLGTELGRWQLRRAEFKLHLATEISEKAQQEPLKANEKDWLLEQANYHQMIATGYWLPEQAVWLENRTHPLGRDPKTGIHVGFDLLMPLQLDMPSKRILWINRGWAPRDFNQINQVPLVPTPREKVHITGIVFPDGGKTFELSKQTENHASDGLNIRENLNLQEEVQIQGGRILPFVLREKTGSIPDGLDKTLPQYQSGVNTHYGYAFQWFGLALMTFLFWVIRLYRTTLKSLR